MKEQMITQERSQAYTEILEILKVLGDNYTYKIPNTLIKYFEKNSLKDYKFNIDYTVDISKQIRNLITINLIGMLKYRFWCSNEEEKKILVNKFIENDKRRERELREKYHPDKIFEHNTISKEEFAEGEVANMSIIEYKKESFIVKIINRLKGTIKKLLN